MGLRRSSAAATLLVVLACAACGTAGEAQTASGGTPTNTSLVLENGGTVTVAVPRLPSEFNPSTPSGDNPLTQMVMQQIWPQLFVTSNQLAVLPQTGLLISAEVVSVSPQRIVYQIDPRARWSDGVEITAADFIYDWHQQLAYGASLPASDPLEGYQDISSIVSSADGKRATVTFSSPYAGWEALFNNLVPAHIATRYGWAAAFSSFDPAKVVSGGPFELASMQPGKELVLVRNPSYWGQPARLSKIVFRVEPTEPAVLSALRRGKVQVAMVSPGVALDKLLQADLHLRARTSASPLLWQLDFNLADPAVSTLALRQAIAAAIDRSQIVSNTIGFLTPYNNLSDNRLYLAGAPGSQGNAQSYDAPQLSESAALFSAAGYHLNASGDLESASGAQLRLELVAPSGDAMMAAVAQELQAQLLQVGIVLRLRTVALSELLRHVLPAGAYQLALAPYSQSIYPSTSAVLYTSPVGPTPVQAASASSTSTSSPVLPSPAVEQLGNGKEPDAVQSGSVTRDVIGLDDPRITSLFEAASSQLNVAAEASLYNEIDAQLWALLPTLPLFQAPTTLVSSIELLNVSNSETWAGPLWDAQLWAIQLNPPPQLSSVTGQS